jgi:glycine/D-amino acid oxidase-like deaminating enzyme
MIASCRAHPGIKRLGHSRIGHLGPALGGRISEALYIPGEAQLDNRAFLRVVAIAVEEAGVVVSLGDFSLKKTRSPMPED